MTVTPSEVEILQMTKRWKDYLSAAIKVGGKCVPGVSQAIEIVEEVHTRREFESRHVDLQNQLTHVERNLGSLITAEIRLALERLQKPNMPASELEAEIKNITMMNQYGHFPYLCEGLLANSSHYRELQKSPHMFGRVLNDADVIRDNCLYVFFDADKSRLLEIPPFTIQQLLAQQPNGVPAAKVFGSQDVFAERVSATPAQEFVATSSLINPTLGNSGPPRQTHVGEYGSGLVDRLLEQVRKKKEANAIRAQEEARELTRRAEAGDVQSMLELGLNNSGLNGQRPNLEQARLWLRKAAEAGNLKAADLLAEVGGGDPVQYYVRAAESGNYHAMYKLSFAYGNGIGVRRDSALALAWRELADELRSEKEGHR